MPVVWSPSDSHPKGRGELWGETPGSCPSVGRFGALRFHRLVNTRTHTHAFMQESQQRWWRQRWRERRVDAGRGWSCAPCMSAALGPGWAACGWIGELPRVVGMLAGGGDGCEDCVVAQICAHEADVVMVC